MQITPLTPRFGAAITGVQLGNLDDAQFAAIKQAWHQHRGLLAFPKQQVSDDGLLVFSRRLGQLDSPPNQENGRQSPEGYPDIYVVSNVKDNAGRPIGALGDGEAVWHTDMSYETSPPLASMLTAREIPASGGDTWFCDMIGICEDLPAALRQRIAPLKVKHDGTYNSGGYLRAGLTATDDPMTSPGTPHPIICRHPQSGEQTLYLGRRRNAYVVGLPRAESEALLDRLWAHVAQPQFAFAHAWRVGDVLMWDNRSTLHRRDPFDAEARRLMYRTQVKGRSLPQQAV